MLKYFGKRPAREFLPKFVTLNQNFEVSLNKNAFIFDLQKPYLFYSRDKQNLEDLVNESLIDSLLLHAKIISPSSEAGDSSVERPNQSNIEGASILSKF